jgi:ParB family chromosome partitioning protein
MNTTPPKKTIRTALGLGKGLGALIPTGIQPPTGATRTSAEVAIPPDDGTIVGITAAIDITKVRPNRLQPRQDFDKQALEDLTKSIKEKGVIQPITVRRVEDGYELIAGERRVRASIEAGLTQIPAYILDVQSDAAMLEIALIENVQRENLNPVEVAMGYQRLIEECSLTQEEVALKVGKDRSTVTNFLRLLRLPLEIQESLRGKAITMGHARSMLALESREDQLAVLKSVLDEGMSVRQTEKLVRDIELGRVKPNAKETEKTLQKKPGTGAQSAIDNSKLDNTLRAIEDQLRHLFATQVKIRSRIDDSGSIEIEYYSAEDLQRLIELFAYLEKNG